MYSLTTKSYSAQTQAMCGNFNNTDVDLCLFSTGFQKLFFKWSPLDKLKNLWPPSTRLLKTLPLKTPKNFF